MEAKLVTWPVTFTRVRERHWSDVVPAGTADQLRELSEQTQSPAFGSGSSSYTGSGHAAHSGEGADGSAGSGVSRQHVNTDRKRRASGNR